MPLTNDESGDQPSGRARGIWQTHIGNSSGNQVEDENTSCE